MREVQQLSNEQLCGQLLVVGFEGTDLPTRLQTALKNQALGGVILFSRNTPDVDTTWMLCRRVAKQAAGGTFPPFISIDQEGGRVRRLKQGVIQAPAMRRLGRLDDATFTRELAQAIAVELVACGFNLNFAPVVDVDSNPANPVIGDRSFGASPASVTRLARCFIEGFQSRGLMACVKHFPGHGDTDLDSHLALPTVRKPSVELRQLEMYPFERLARSSACLMSAHVVFESMDSLPATLSSRLLTDLLRNEFSFEGVTFSDDLEMGALNDHWPIEETAVRAVRAGCDTLLICRDEELQQRAHVALIKQVEADPAFRQRCVVAVSRSLGTRRKYPPNPAATLGVLHAALQDERGQRVRQRLAALDA